MWHDAKFVMNWRLALHYRDMSVDGTRGAGGWHIWHWWNSMKRPQSWQCFRSNASLAKRTCFINLQPMAGNSVQAGCIANVSCGIWTVASACFSPLGNKKIAPPFSVLAFFGSRCCGVSNKQHVWKNGITSRFESYRIVSDQTDFSNRTTVCIPRNFVCNCLGVVFVLFCFTIWWSYKTSSKRNWLQFSGCNDARRMETCYVPAASH